MSRANPRFRRINPNLPVYPNPVYLVQAIGASEAGIWYMDFGYAMTAAGQSAASEANIAATWLTTNGANLRAVMTPQAALNSVKVTCVSTPTRIPYTNTTSAFLGNGTAAGQAEPSTTASILSKYTTTKGQHGRGRNYFPNVPTAFISPVLDPDRLNAAALVAYGTFITSLTGVGTTDAGNVANLCIYTRTARGAPVTLAALVTVVVMRQLLGNIRRRRIGRGK